jgi:predicted type IV restriction endonuclease
MPEDVIKRLQVTFSIGLPLGTRATFNHDGELWIAVPAKKYQQITSVSDRLLGALSHIQKRMVSWLASNPGDTDRISMLLDTIARAEAIRREATIDKARAVTA